MRRSGVRVHTVAQCLVREAPQGLGHLRGFIRGCRRERVLRPSPPAAQRSLALDPLLHPGPGLDRLARDETFEGHAGRRKRGRALDVVLEGAEERRGGAAPRRGGHRHIDMRRVERSESRGVLDRLLPRAVHRQVTDDVLPIRPVVERGLGERPHEPLGLAGELVQLHLEPAKVRLLVPGPEELEETPRDLRGLAVGKHVGPLVVVSKTRDRLEQLEQQQRPGVGHVLNELLDVEGLVPLGGHRRLDPAVEIKGRRLDRGGVRPRGIQRKTSLRVHQVDAKHRRDQDGVGDEGGCRVNPKGEHVVGGDSATHAPLRRGCPRRAAFTERATDASGREKRGNHARLDGGSLFRVHFHLVGLFHRGRQDVLSGGLNGKCRGRRGRLGGSLGGGCRGGFRLGGGCRGCGKLRRGGRCLRGCLRGCHGRRGGGRFLLILDCDLLPRRPGSGLRRRSLLLLRLRRRIDRGPERALNLRDRVGH
mmetsp:Transcript_8201/g.33632  ORF Transcript_8201/g.33632 Transcript_8201/m.33632 type:complete len:477 (+) Transcript_8201:1603-3033(+)